MPTTKRAVASAKYELTNVLMAFMITDPAKHMKSVGRRPFLQGKGHVFACYLSKYDDVMMI